MFFRRANYTHPEFKQGLRDFQRLAPGIAAWSLMTGVAMVKSGIGVFEAQGCCQMGSNPWGSLNLRPDLVFSAKHRIVRR